MPLTTIAPVVSTSEAVPTRDGTTEEGSSATTLPTVPAGQYLEDALHGRAAGYRFVTVISAGTQVATTVSGSVVGTSSQVVVSSGGADVEYLSTPEGRWVKGDDDLWSELDSAPSSVPPLGALEGSLLAEYVLADGNIVVVRATYPGSVLGTPAIPQIAVEFEISDGQLVLMRYETTVGEAVVTSETELVDLDLTVVISVPPIEG